MERFLSQFQFSEAAVRLTAFLAVFAAMAIWEKTAPRRELLSGKASRWSANLSIIVMNTLLVRLVFLIMPVAMAGFARSKGWGLLNLAELPAWLGIFLGVALLDLAVYLQHVMFHTLPLLWRFHLVHHSDLDVDVTTGLRFHPIEILISMAIKLAAVSVIGASPAAVVIFEIVLNGMAMFNHGNVRMPEAADRALRALAVTPDMHRVHHSVNIRETNSNFGFNLSWWDHIFGTYRARPASGHLGMAIGLAQYRDSGELSLLKILVLPFYARRGGYDISGHGQEPQVKKETESERQGDPPRYGRGH